MANNYYAFDADGQSGGYTNTKSLTKEYAATKPGAAPSTAANSAGSAGGASTSGAYVAAAGGFTQGLGSIIQGEMQGDALDFQASVAAQNSKEAKEQGQFDAMKSGLISGQRIGNISAGYGASGVSTMGGSAAAVLMSSRANAELDRLNILHQADIKAVNFDNQASLDRMGANNSRTGGFLGGVSGLITSGAALTMLA